MTSLIPLPLDSLPQLIRPICVSAGDATLTYFHGSRPLATRTKADASPVTQADLHANRVIEAGLAQLPWSLPVLTEESATVEFATRRHWRQYWLVDPLDGTREFLEGSEQYTVNIALIEAGRPRWGAIYQPVTGDFYWGGAGLGAWLGFANPKALGGAPARVSAAGAEPLRVITSKRHGTGPLADWWQGFSAHHPSTKVACGSSLKFCLLAAGGADLYPRFGATSEWDTGAGQAILEGAGGQVVTLDGQALGYNRKASTLNPEFVALGCRDERLLGSVLQYWPRCREP